MRRHAIGPTGMALMGLVVACDSSPDTTPHAVRDSAGIRIVEAAGASEAEAPWTIPPEPVFRVGWDDDGLLIEDLVSGIVLTDRRILVADGGSRLLHILDSSGEVITTFGGGGEGPREFGTLDAVVPVRGDTIVVQDGGNGRLSMYARDVLVDNIPFVPWVGSTMFGLVGRVGDGYALWTLAFRDSGEANAGWHRSPVLRLELDPMSLDTIAMVGLHVHPEHGDHNPIQPVGTVSVAGGEVVYGTSDRPELTWVTGDGTVRQIARWDATAVELDDGDWAAYERSYRERYADRYEPAALERRLAERRADFSGTRPYFRAAFGDREGDVWLSPYELGRFRHRSRVYSVVTREGRYLGDVPFPRPIRLLDISGDLALGVEYDDFDVQAVALYRIEGRVDGPEG